MTFQKRFKFIEKSNSVGEISLVPHLPFRLSSEDHSISTSGLLDTGASVNVLPYDMGLELGLDWDKCNISVALAGNLAKFPAKGVISSATIDQFAPVTLVFAWTKSENIPLLLGRINFFQEFDVCFYGSQLAFEISPKSI
ncbi:retroviral-like aspartic protease [Dolichospermum sp. LEGE 00240]|uniref:aspartyl protease family protein n=1 Tax=Dolichospermum sp. LEGE 00240 TaxID=1828603 RepID=UPI00187F408E|nr:aspartyl protease family protein [Dolichospermum sp. LEGE 00240]MBE9250585.1 retroviral-like aspartic protease [Dolichospermum sp. LEGE 00240]